MTPSCNKRNILYVKIYIYILHILGTSVAHAAGQVRSVRSGRELALALAEPDVTRVQITTDIVLMDSDWCGLGVLPLLMERNVSVVAAPEQCNLISIDLAFVKDKVRLSPGVSLTFKGLIIIRYREDLPSSTPGFDLLANTILPAGTDAAANPAVLIILDGALVNRLCFPANYSRQSLQATPRPFAFPGEQRMTSNLPQDGCTNNASAPWLQRCFAVRRHYIDIATPGVMFDNMTRPVRTMYFVIVRNVSILCTDLMTDECVEKLTPFGCYYQQVTRVTTGSSPPPPPLHYIDKTGATSSSSSSMSAGAVVSCVVGSVTGAGVIAFVLYMAVVAYRRRQSNDADGMYTDSNKGMNCGDSVESPPPTPQLLPPSCAVSSLRRVMLEVNATDTGQEGSCLQGPGPNRSNQDVCRSSSEAVALELSASGSGRFRHSSPEALQDQPLPAAMAATTDTEAEGGPNGTSAALRIWGSAPTGNEQQPDCGQVTPPANQAAGAAVQSPAAVGLATAGALTVGALPPAATGATGNPSVGVEANDHDADNEAPLTEFTPLRDDMEMLANPAAPSNDTELRILPNSTRGRGAFGRVVEGVYQGQHVAVKLVADVHQWCGPPESLLRSFVQEVEVLGRCQHPNIVRLLAACLTIPQLCLVMELMETSLNRLLYEHPTTLLPLPTVLHIALEIAKGLAYLHPTIVHRDLKPANVLLNRAKTARPVVKISDFGLARIRSTAVPTLTPCAGTPAYLAPEGIQSGSSSATITHRADIYSLAVLLWEMLAGQKPWRGCSVFEVAFKVSRGVRLPLDHLSDIRCPPKLRALITECWDGDPQRRPAAAEVVKMLTLASQEAEAKNVDDIPVAPPDASSASAAPAAAFAAAAAGALRDELDKQKAPAAAAIDISDLRPRVLWRLTQDPSVPLTTSNIAAHAACTKDGAASVWAALDDRTPPVGGPGPSPAGATAIAAGAVPMAVRAVAAQRLHRAGGGAFDLSASSQPSGSTGNPSALAYLTLTGCDN